MDIINTNIYNPRSFYMNAKKCVYKMAHLNARTYHLMAKKICLPSESINIFNT